MIFYAPDCSMQHSEYTLSELESKHCIKVLRKVNGDKIELVNGKGGQFVCEIIDVGLKSSSQLSMSHKIKHSMLQWRFQKVVTV